MLFGPRLVFWEIDKRCNLKCPYCRRGSYSDEVLTKDRSFQIVDSIAKAYRTLVVFSGGEPLVYPHIFEVAYHAKERGLNIALATNGTLVDEDMAQEIKRIDFHRVAVSLDGASPETNDLLRGEGTFSKAARGIENLASLGLSLQINTTVLRRNVKEVRSIYRLCLKWGVDALHLFAFVPVGCGVGVPKDERLSSIEYERFLNDTAHLSAESKLEIKVTCAPHFHRVLRERAPDYFKTRGLGRGCLAGNGVCFISSSGEVFPCGYLPLSAGNIFSGDFKNIWEGSSLFQRLRDISYLKGRCALCEYVDSCGGCRARAWAASGDYMEEEPDCVYQPSTVKY